MPHIRSYSNPERLYIWCDVRGSVHVSHRVERDMASREQSFTVPRHVFQHVCFAWHERGPTDVSYRGLKVDEVALYEGTGKKFKPSRKHPFGDGKPWRIVVRFAYRGHYFCMWPVTWEHVVRGVVDRVKRTKARRKTS